MADEMKGTMQHETLIAHLEGLTPEILRDDKALATTVRQAVGKLALKARDKDGSELSNIAIAVTAYTKGGNT